MYTEYLLYLNKLTKEERTEQLTLIIIFLFIIFLVIFILGFIKYKCKDNVKNKFIKKILEKL